MENLKPPVEVDQPIADAERPATEKKMSVNDTASDAEKVFVFSEGESAQIIRQIEFYFSESNLPRDRFLLERLAEGNDFVSLELICTFAKMRPLVGLADPTSKPKPAVLTAVGALMKQSQSLQLSEDGCKIGRVVALDVEAARGQLERRSLFCSPLPWNATMSNVEEEFGKYGQVKSVRMRRHPGSKDFKGSVFVEFSSEEEAEKVMQMDVVVFGAKTTMQKRADFESEAGKESDDRTEPPTKDPPSGSKRKQPEEPSFTAGVIVAIQVRKKGEEEVIKTRGDGNGEGEDPVEGEEEDGEKGAKSAGTSEMIGREQLKESFAAFGQVRYVDFNRNDISGFIRFETADEAKLAVEKGTDGVAIANTHIATVRAVEGKEEKEYWENVRAGQDNKRRSFDRGGRGGGRFGRGGGRSWGRGGGGGSNFRGGRGGQGRGRGRN